MGKDFFFKGDEDIIFQSPDHFVSSNGLYVYRAGETFPSKEYHIKRVENTGVVWGGVYVLEYILDGAEHIKADGRSLLATSGDLVFMNAKRDVEYYSEEEQPVHKLWINFSGPFARALTEAFHMTKSVYISDCNGESSLRIIHDMLKEMNGEGDRNSCLDAIALEICRLLLALNNKNTSEELRIHREKTAAKIKNYIDSFDSSSITLDDVAARFGYDKAYIIHSFKKEYDISPYKYIIRRRINIAKNLLGTTGMSVGAVSSALGFTGVRHFSTTFKKYTGLTPSEFKKKYQ